MSNIPTHIYSPPFDEDAPDYIRKPYVHGDESDAGDFKPISIRAAATPVFVTLANQGEILQGGNCDSPIEEMLGAFILTVFEENDCKLHLCNFAKMSELKTERLLVPQFKWHHYRSDWAIIQPAESDRALLVEADGADFHSSPEQIEHDKRKDSAALDYGHITIRFPGRLIHKDPRGCARKVFDIWSGSNAA